MDYRHFTVRADEDFHVLLARVAEALNTTKSELIRSLVVAKAKRLGIRQRPNKDAE